MGNRAVDRRTTVGKALASRRDALIADLGGDVAKRAVHRFEYNDLR